MELKQLEYFMVTCEKGSFNKAAECLYTTQPNVSKVISSLEKELVEKYHGTIDVDTEIGEGTSNTVSFQRLHAQEEDVCTE